MARARRPAGPKSASESFSARSRCSGVNLDNAAEIPHEGFCRGISLTLDTQERRCVLAGLAAASS